MRAEDFYYDGSYLSDFGFIMVEFNEEIGGIIEATAGNTIEFTRATQMSGAWNPLISSRYSEAYQIEFGICKPDGSEVTFEEHELIMTWLNRKDFHEFRIVSEDENLNDIIFNGSFNVVKQTHIGKTVGFNLTFNSDSTFGYKPEIKKTLTFESAGSSAKLNNASGEIGYLYPDEVKVTINGSGDLTLTNTLEGRATYIKGCSQGEVITFYGKTRVVESSLNSHKVLDNFNFNFPRLYRTYSDISNIFTSSIPCTVEITYRPICKVVF